MHSSRLLRRASASASASISSARLRLGGTRSIGSSSSSSEIGRASTSRFHTPSPFSASTSSASTKNGSFNSLFSCSYSTQTQPQPQQTEAESSSSSSSNSTPWFLQEEEEIQLDDSFSNEFQPSTSTSISQLQLKAPSLQPSEILQPSFDSEVSTLPSLPYQLDSLRTHLLTSSSSNLLSKQLPQEEISSSLAAEAAFDWESDPDARFGDELETSTSEPHGRKEREFTSRSIPLRFIDSRSISEGEAWTDWIVVVQVRGSAGGTVRRVAQDIGEHLKYLPPLISSDSSYPSAIHDDPLDQLLGLGLSSSSSTPSSSASSSSSSKPLTELEILGPRPPGMSRIEWRSGKNLEPWQVQKLALLKKFKPCESQDHDQNRDQDREGLNSNTNWKPKKILSREAQDGLRLIHESNPKVFGSKELSRQFGISSESVRRILKAGSDPKWLRKKKDEEDLTDQLEEDGSEIAEGVRERQNRRARERLEERKEEIRRKAKMGEMSDEFELKGEFKEIREEVEIERIKEMIRKEVSQDLDLDSSLEEEEEISSTQTFSSTSSSRKPLTQIFYEGLVDPSSSNSSGSSSASEIKKSYSKSSPKARGDGEWCLIDAGWCVVHVMTKEARVRWDVESVWERKWRESMREEQERRRKVEGELQEGL